ncbi:4-hydroxy-tetrahydrodipicolinate reductase [Labrys okinawensis]|uniref:4-hydroxy-tetrahydrodipicolinate reductase n=1 Tax=Labrys okinawensis TaxID=346911 RepID=UPI0039BD7508
MADIGLVVAGPSGRMGRTLIRMIAETPGVTLCGALARPGSAAVGADCGRLAGLEPNGMEVMDDPHALPETAQVILDFTTPATTVALATLAARRGMVLVSGTTGLSPDDFARLRDASRHAVIVHSGNMGLGINLLAAMIRRAARSLDAEFDIEILEMHHGRKVDAPSGTALLLGQAAADGRGIDLESRSDRRRDGHTGAREKGHIGFATLRGGTVIGEHSVILAGEHERIEFRHKAEDRTMFARGALRAALWGLGRAPGLYSMADVLGLAEQ